MTGADTPIDALWRLWIDPDSSDVQVWEGGSSPLRVYFSNRRVLTLSHLRSVIETSRAVCAVWGTRSGDAVVIELVDVPADCRAELIPHERALTLLAVPSVELIFSVVASDFGGLVARPAPESQRAFEIMRIAAAVAERRLKAVLLDGVEDGRATIRLSLE